MKFFVVSTEDAGTIDCTLSIRAAHRSGRGTKPDGDYMVDMLVIDVRSPTEIIRRMLGNLGGYCREMERVYPKE